MKKRNHSDPVTGEEFAMSFEQIAEELGMSKQRVQQTYARAMRKLRKLLRKNPAWRDDLRAMLTMEPVADQPQTGELQLGFPDVWNWTIIPSPLRGYSNQVRERALRTLDLVP